MAFSIVGAVFATVLTVIGVPLSLYESLDTNNVKNNFVQL